MKKARRTSHDSIATTRSAGATHIGYCRNRNEDALWGDETQGIWMVADGLGGHSAGNLASQTVVEAIQLASTTDHQYKHALQRAHTLLIDRGKGPGTMGSTAVVAKENGYHFDIYWVGDSRAYLWTPGPNNGQLKQLTVDHSYVQALLDSGAINPTEAATHPQRNLIIRCVGGSSSSPLEVDHLSRAWQREQKLLLCSDGLNNAVNTAQICQILDHNADNLRATRLLIDAALNAGGKDNITVLLISAPENDSTSSPFATTPSSSQSSSSSAVRSARKVRE